MSFGDQIKKARNKKGITQEGLAELLDVSRQTISEWERGESYPKFEKLTMLPQILGESIDILMAEEIVKISSEDNWEELLPGAAAGLKAFAIALSNMKETHYNKSDKSSN